jgi:hypothetical protein
MYMNLKFCDLNEKEADNKISLFEKHFNLKS